MRRDLELQDVFLPVELADLLRDGKPRPHSQPRFVFGVVTTAAANNLRARPDGMPSGDIGPLFRLGGYQPQVNERVLLSYLPETKDWVVVGSLEAGNVLSTFRAAGGDQTGARVFNPGANGTKSYLGFAFSATPTVDRTRFGAYMNTGGSIAIIEVADNAGTLLEMMALSLLHSRIGINDYPIGLRGVSDANHYVKYQGSFDGPELGGYGGMRYWSTQRAATHFGVDGGAPPANSDTVVGTLVYKDSAGTIKSGRVTVGAADSGGAGFRVLRVAN